MTHKPMTDATCYACGHVAAAHNNRADTCVADGCHCAQFVHRTPAPAGEVAETTAAAFDLRSIALGFGPSLQQDMLRKFADMIESLSARCAALEGERDNLRVVGEAYEKLCAEKEAKLAASEAALEEARERAAQVADSWADRMDSIAKAEDVRPARDDRDEQDLQRRASQFRRKRDLAASIAAEIRALSPQPKTEGTK